ncbi:MAG TPA: phosphatase PAP2 family protein [Patescibacteria group bacterium]|nr:phosphatase PAP2 family protein [Patescibacteria group bacterium]
MDEKILYLINHLPHNAALNVFAQAIDFLTSAGIIFVVLFLINFLARQKERRQLAKVIFFSLAANLIIVELAIKNLVQRVRPFDALTEVIKVGGEPWGYSFPSGQTALAFGVAMAYVLIFPKKIETYLIIIFAVIVGLVRIYLGDHYPSDVAAGAVIGSAIGWGIFIINQKLKIKM